MKEIERIVKALANRRRLAILKCLKHQREASVGQIADQIKLSLKATSKHLNLLAHADLVDKEQRSLTVFYRLNPNQRTFVKSLINEL
ncbi:MAG: metalloregulator ArsR/SmtB family transcription factor [Candidatus Doudnabacteria bacterium]